MQSDTARLPAFCFPAEIFATPVIPSRPLASREVLLRRIAYRCREQACWPRRAS